MLLRRSTKGDLRAPRSRVRRRDSEAVEQVREFYTVSQLADLLQLTEMTIYRMVNRAELPCYAIGRVKRFRHRDIEEFLDRCRVPAVAESPGLDARQELKVRGRPRGTTAKAQPAAQTVPDLDLGEP